MGVSFDNGDLIRGLNNMGPRILRPFLQLVDCSRTLRNVQFIRISAIAQIEYPALRESREALVQKASGSPSIGGRSQHVVRGKDIIFTDLYYLKIFIFQLF